METWKILLITFLSAILLGCIAGVIIGKIQVKRMHSRRGPVVSRKEFLILTAIVLVGVGCVLYGVFFANPSEDAVDPMNPDGIMGNEGMADPGMDVPETDPGADIAVDEVEEDAAEPIDADSSAEGSPEENSSGEDDNSLEEPSTEEPASTDDVADSGGGAVMVRPAI